MKKFSWKHAFFCVVMFKIYMKAQCYHVFSLFSVSFYPPLGKNCNNFELWKIKTIHTQYILNIVKYTVYFQKLEMQCFYWAIKTLVHTVYMTKVHMTKVHI